MFDLATANEYEVARVLASFVGVLLNLLAMRHDMTGPETVAPAMRHIMISGRKRDEGAILLCQGLLLYSGLVALLSAEPNAGLPRSAQFQAGTTAQLGVTLVLVVLSFLRHHDRGALQRLDDAMVARRERRRRERDPRAAVRD